VYSRQKKNRRTRDVDMAENDQLNGKEIEQASLNMVHELRQIIKMIEIRRIKFFGHVMQHNTFIINIMEGRMNGERGRRRPRDTNLGNIMKLLSLKNYKKIKRLTDIREEWSQW